MITVAIDQTWMQRALELARRAEQLGEVPVGAVLVADGREIACGWNRSITACDPTAHAEIVALREAGVALGNYRLPGTTLYVTLEPCAMCYVAMVHARIARLIYGADDPKSGAITTALALPAQSLFNHKMEISGNVLAVPCADMLRAFFQRRRGTPVK